MSDISRIEKWGEVFFKDKFNLNKYDLMYFTITNQRRMEFNQSLKLLIKILYH